SGGDNLAVAVKEPSKPAPNNGDLPISGSLILPYPLGSLSLTGAPIIIEQPISTTALELQNAVFRVVFDGKPPYRITWRKNGAVIRDVNPGIDGEDILVVGAAASDNGAVITAEVKSVAGSVVSAPAALTVTPINPRVQTVVWSESFEGPTPDW